MNILLDTHSFLWWQEQSKKLKPHVQYLIANPENTVYISTASIWELAIKASLGKIKIPKDVKSAISTNHFLILPVSIDHALAVQHLPKHHTDPFDRMLVAQAIVENLTIVSRDEELKRYDVQVAW